MTIDINELRKDKRPQSSIVVQALLDRLETAENDAAHQKALAASALRVAEGWERKCGELRAKIEAMERQKPAGKFIQHPSNGLCVPDDGFKRGVECAVAFVARKAELYAIRFGDDDARRHILSVLVDELCGLFKVQPAPSVPDGWKLMPAISTYGMITAGLKTSHVLNVHRVLACYDAMFAAAPEAKP